MIEKEQFIEIYNGSIKRPGAGELLKWLEKSDFFEAPASTKYHLSRPGGLVKHSINVYDRYKGLLWDEKVRLQGPDAELTAEEEESAAICALLHDICKVGVYQKKPKNQKTYDKEKIAAAPPYQVKHDELGDFIWESVMGYEFDDQMPYGHGEKSVYIVSGYMKLKREEAMAIRWHMGACQDGEKNEAMKAFSIYPNALLLHIADMMATCIDESEVKAK